MSATAAEEVSIRDPYEVLGVEKSATEDQIKSAYKKCALKYHPDKNRGEGAEEAEKKFKEVVTAFNILSDPDKRRRYDAGGFENLEASDLSVELDLSSMGWGNTMVAAMFSKLGALSPHPPSPRAPPFLSHVHSITPLSPSLLRPASFRTTRTTCAHASPHSPSRLTPPTPSTVRLMACLCRRPHQNHRVARGA